VKILYHHRTRSKDGQYVHIEEMITAFRGLGHEVIIVAPPLGENEDFGSDSRLVVWMKRSLPQFIYELMEFSYSFIAYLRLSRAVRRHRPDCLYERYNLFLPAGVWLKHRYNLPMLLEVNSPLYQEREKYDGISLKRLARWSERYTWRGADFVLPVTQVLANHVAREGVPTDRIKVIPNGINIDRFGVPPDTEAAKRALGLNGHLVLGFTGFVRDWHGLDKVIDLIAQDTTSYPRHLLVVGDGPARSALESQAKGLKIADRVTFTGIVGRDDVARYVAAFDIALQPALVSYASPLKLFEYLALGRAIVAPAQPNIMEVLRNEENAILFNPDAPDGLAFAIERATRDHSLRAKVAEGARNSIAQQGLTWRNNAKRIINIINQQT